MPDVTQQKDQLVQALGIAHFTPEQQDEVLDLLGKTTMQRAMIKVLDVLPDQAKRDELEALVGGGDGGKLQAFLQEHVPTIEQIFFDSLQETITEHQRMTAQYAQSAGQQPQS